MTEIGTRIRMKRLELGLSGEHVGKMLGVDKTTIYRYEKGEIEKLPISIIKKLANILHTTPEYLMGWSDDKSTIPPIQTVPEPDISKKARAVARKYDAMSPKNQKTFDRLLAAMQEDDEDDD